MALDTNALQTAVKEAFKKAKETPPPSDPSQADSIQTQILDQLSADLAGAINTFVRGGDVTGITVQVTNQNNQVIGTGTETGAGKIQ